MKGLVNRFLEKNAGLITFKSEVDRENFLNALNQRYQIRDGVACDPNSGLEIDLDKACWGELRAGRYITDLSFRSYRSPFKDGRNETQKERHQKLVTDQVKKEIAANNLIFFTDDIYEWAVSKISKHFFVESDPEGSPVYRRNLGGYFSDPVKLNDLLNEIGALDYLHETKTAIRKAETEAALRARAMTLAGVNPSSIAVKELSEGSTLNQVNKDRMKKENPDANTLRFSEMLSLLKQEAKEALQTKGRLSNVPSKVLLQSEFEKEAFSHLGILKQMSTMPEQREVDFAVQRRLESLNDFSDIKATRPNTPEAYLNEVQTYEGI